MDIKRGKKKINRIHINGLLIDIQPLTSIQYCYEYKEQKIEEINSLKYISDEIRKDIGDDFQVFLFAVSPSWLEDTRITRYKKYWNELQSHDLLHGKVELKDQLLFKDLGRIRYGLICSIPYQHFSSVLQYSLENKTSGLFMLKDNDVNFRTITKSLFESSTYKYNSKFSSLINWEGFINTVVKNSGIALIPQGWYDFGALQLNVISK